MNVKKTCLALAFALCALAMASGIGVDTQELKTATQKVEFVNFTGRHAVIETVDQIRGIGQALAAGAGRGESPALLGLKYSALHMPELKEAGRFGADIISIDRESRVDHIDNVRRVLSGYLEALYRYSRADADTLALFATYYNAVYRGNMTYFTAKYQSAVVAKLEPARAGLSTKYFEWPGATQVLIPLSEAGGQVLGALNASELGSKAVVEQLQQQQDKGIAERQALVDLKAREAEAAKQAVEQERQQVAQAQAATAQAAEAAKQAKAEAERLAAQGTAAEAQKAAETARQEAERLAQQQAAQKAAEEKLAADQQAVAKREAEVAAEKQQIATDQVAVQAETQPERLAQTLEQKAADLAQREAEVAKREEVAAKGETDSSIYGGKLYYLKIKDYLTGGHYNNDMLIINATTGKLLYRSPEANICGRKFDIFSSGVVIIGHHGDHAAGHFLELLSLDDLSSKAVGADPVFYRGFVEVRDDFVYAIINNPDGYYLGKYNAELKRVAISKDKIDGDSFVSFFGDLIYINREDKKILVLNREDLSTKSVIEP